MRKLLCGFFALAATGAFAAPGYTEQTNSARAGMQTNRVGAGNPNMRLSVPVTTTTTTNTYIPEVDETETSSETITVDLNGQRAACLMTAGNVWANRLNASPDGVPATFPMSENANAADNACFTLVSMRSDDIKNMGRFFPPRYFRQGDAVECGSWLDQQVLDDAILDAKKTGRIAGTIAASVGGAAVGVGITELIGRKFLNGFGFEGQLDYADWKSGSEKLFASLCNDRNAQNKANFAVYRQAIDELSTACGGKEAAASAPDEVKEACASAVAIKPMLDKLNCGA